MPIIDIILLTYNNLSNSKKCIENIYKYTDDFNLFILDNGSEDGTIKYLKDIEEKHSNIYINYQENNLGIIRGRNECYKFSREHSNSEVIIFLDNDQMVLSGWLNSYIELMKKFNIVGVEAWSMRKSDFYPCKRMKNKDESFNYVGCGGMMTRSEVFEGLGLFDVRFSPMFFEDPDFIFRAFDAGHKIGWNYQNVIIHDHKGLMLTKKTKQHFIDSWLKFRKKWKDYKMPVFRME